MIQSKIFTQFLIIFCILVITPYASFAQNYSFKSAVEKANENGFHKILLAPNVSSKLNADFSDIRIYDKTKKEIPYVFQTENPINESMLFKEYEIIETEHNSEKGYTRIVIHNASKTTINNIVLRIKNADVRKQLKLNASYDNKKWYVLKDNYAYNSISSSGNTSEIRVLDFPLSDYEYYELLISDYYDNPINITQAGYYDLITEQGKYTKIKSTKPIITTVLKETTIKIPLSKNYVNQINFKINNPKYFSRNAELYIHQTITNRKRKEIHNDHVRNITLISNSGNSFNFNNLHADTLFVRIRNNDDQALEITDIELLQLNKYLVADLELKISYTISYSDKNAQKPVYDLTFFTDKIPNEIKVLKTLEPKEIVSKEKATKNEVSKNYWLWIIILGVGLLLSYMSFSMIKKS